MEGITKEERLWTLCKRLVRGWHYKNTENGLYMLLMDVMGEMTQLCIELEEKRGNKWYWENIT